MTKWWNTKIVKPNITKILISLSPQKFASALKELKWIMCAYKHDRSLLSGQFWHPTTSCCDRKWLWITIKRRDSVPNLFIRNIRPLTYPEPLWQFSICIFRIFKIDFCRECSHIPVTPPPISPDGAVRDKQQRRVLRTTLYPGRSIRLNGKRAEEPSTWSPLGQLVESDVDCFKFLDFCWIFENLNFFPALFLRGKVSGLIIFAVNFFD